ncbi:MAG: peptidylprolyl isomerase [Rhodospirillales bacterium]|nr:peptidylprolyl isomerase [Rhodospirillales bacterium]MCW8861142.1 peptidylprolyl isomerase [Rhodospirillales bacterium]MCW8951724.1 peptidylprolyl isomerase [Rhodospirillales bacterium]MCW8969922.1 peptidylprolyl isomerase [Rhodospirillales bacterium]
MSDQVKASHILLMYAGSARSSATRTKDEALSAIEALKQKLDSGEDFADLARKNSDCPSGSDGGNLGLFGRGAMVRAFEDAAFGLDVGAVSGVVETDFGYHLIMRTA